MHGPIMGVDVGQPLKALCVEFFFFGSVVDSLRTGFKIAAYAPPSGCRYGEHLRQELISLLCTVHTIEN
jgi:hypothetical protein